MPGRSSRAGNAPTSNVDKKRIEAVNERKQQKRAERKARREDERALVPGRFRTRNVDATCLTSWIRREDGSIEYTIDEVHVERLANKVSVVLTTDEALRLIREDDASISKRTKSSVITRITWCNTPPGFEVPAFSAHAGTT